MLPTAVHAKQQMPHRHLSKFCTQSLRQTDPPLLLCIDLVLSLFFVLFRLLGALLLSSQLKHLQPTWRLT